MVKEILEQKLQEKSLEKFSSDSESSQKVKCGYCGKKLNFNEAFYSPEKFPYCDDYCFIMFTED